MLIVLTKKELISVCAIQDILEMEHNLARVRSFIVYCLYVTIRIVSVYFEKEEMWTFMIMEP